MNIEKIKNYNQRLLAIAGTLGCLLLLLLIAMVVIEMWPWRYSGTPRIPQGLIAEENVEILNQENLRKQIISYESPWLIDTLNTVYLVPVSIKTLNKPEEVAQRTEPELFLNTRSSIAKEKGYYQHRSFKGEYANLILYEPRQRKTTSLFEERVIVGNVNSYYFKDDILLTCYTASKDTDKNGVIDLEDLRNLCIYSLKTGLMRVVSDEENQLEKFQFIENSKDLLITFTLSQYNRRQFANNQSPGKIMKYNYEMQTLENIIPQDIEQQMQMLVEGK